MFCLPLSPNSSEDLSAVATSSTEFYSIAPRGSGSGVRISGGGAGPLSVRSPRNPSGEAPPSPQPPPPSESPVVFRLREESANLLGPLTTPASTAAMVSSFWRISTPRSESIRRWHQSLPVIFSNRDRFCVPLNEICRWIATIWGSIILNLLKYFSLDDTGSLRIINTRNGAYRKPFWSVDSWGFE